MPTDPQYPPLLSAGFHDLALPDLRPLLVAPFGGSTRRADLLSRFLTFHAIIESWNCTAVLWLNGSYFTEKVDPDDIDVVLLMSGSDYNLMAPGAQRELVNLVSNRDETKVRYGVDFYYCTPEDFDKTAYWKGVFGFDRDDNPKGIARLHCQRV